MNRVPEDITGQARIAFAHRQVAFPDVAGHPAGAAVDVRLVESGSSIDLGTDLWAYDLQEPRKIYFGSPDVYGAAARYRIILRNAMCAAGFAPFDGEWWHFSYGDKEWAAYARKPAAIYDQIEFKPSYSDATGILE